MVQKAGIGAAGIALIAGVAIVVATMSTRLSTPAIDTGLVLAMAESQGYVTPAAADQLKERVERTEADLASLREIHPDWANEIDAAITAFNNSDLGSAREAFARVDSLIATQREELRLEQARSKQVQATLFYPFEFSQSEPLLCEAAELAGTEFWYWIDCGRAREATGKSAEALGAFEKAHELATQSGSERDRSVALNEIGDIRKTQGDLKGALVAYEDTLLIAQSLMKEDPGNALLARDVSVSLNEVGDVLKAQGNLPEAVTAYEQALDIVRKLAEADPDNADLARDVFVSFNKVGDVRKLQDDLAGALEVYEPAVEIAQDLVALDSNNPASLRSLSVILESIGDVRIQQNDVPEALNCYRASLEIARDLVARDQGNTKWARDVSVSLNKFGDVWAAQGDHSAAVEAYSEALEIRHDLLSRDPRNAGWALDVVVSHWKLAESDKDRSSDHWEEVVVRLQVMMEEGTLHQSRGQLLDIARSKLEMARSEAN